MIAIPILNLAQVVLSACAAGNKMVIARQKERSRSRHCPTKSTALQIHFTDFLLATARSFPHAFAFRNGPALWSRGWVGRVTPVWGSGVTDGGPWRTRSCGGCAPFPGLKVPDWDPCGSAEVRQARIEDSLVHPVELFFGDQEGALLGWISNKRTCSILLDRVPLRGTAPGKRIRKDRTVRRSTKLIFACL
jgi:hypothetical protein